MLCSQNLDKLIFKQCGHKLDVAAGNVVFGLIVFFAVAGNITFASKIIKLRFPFETVTRPQDHGSCVDCFLQAKSQLRLAPSLRHFKNICFPVSCIFFFFAKMNPKTGCFSLEESILHVKHCYSADLFNFECGQASGVCELVPWNNL